MTSREFCYWLQGYFEITKEANGLTQEQSEIIQKHLSLVFIHEIDNSYGNKEHTDKLNKVHDDPPLPQNLQKDSSNYYNNNSLPNLRPRC